MDPIVLDAVQTLNKFSPAPSCLFRFRRVCTQIPWTWDLLQNIPFATNLVLQNLSFHFYLKRTKVFSPLWIMKKTF